MTGIDLFSSKTCMALLAAGGYALATLLMKLTAESATLLLFAGIAAVLTVTVMAEIVLLRQVEVGLAYVAIIATETVLVLAITVLVGEPMTLRDMVGGAFVITGAAIVSF